MPRAEELRVVRLESREKVVRVPAGMLVSCPGGLQPLTRELADRFQHPVALVGEANEALLDERLQDVEVGRRNVSCGFEGAPSGEDRKRARESLLLV